MTIPERLIEAVLDEYAVLTMNGRVDLHVTHFVAERLIAAAFGALPQCDEAVDVVATALLAAWRKQPYVGQTAQHDAETAVAALARMAQPAASSP